MATEISGELLRLLSILSVRAHGASEYELVAVEGVNASVTYKAVMLDLVYAHLLSDEERATYRYYLLERGRALLSSPDDSAAHAEINRAILRTTSRARRATDVLWGCGRPWNNEIGPGVT
jgi:hypothetical protein